MINDNVIGENIRKIRKEKGYSQDVLAKRCQMSNSALSAYETSKKIPNISTLGRIAEGLGASLDQLCYGDESEAFINATSSEGRKIVNCIYTLWETGVIDYFEYSLNHYGTMGLGDEFLNGGYIHLRRYQEPIKRLIKSLDEFEKKKDTFPDSELYLENILSSVANEIEQEMGK